jgi:arylformamidase
MNVRTEPVYLGMDQATLDAEYDNRAAAPDFDVWQALRTERSARARQTMRCELDVAYGNSPAQALDIFPAGPGAPVEVYIHGGAWKLKTKADVSFIAEALVPAGVTFVALDHDRAAAPAVTLDDIVAQIRAALAWVHRNIAARGGDPERIHVAGHSSGAHLAAMALATPWRDFGLPADVIKGACLTSGLFDLEPLRLASRNEYLALDEAAVERLSPIHHIPATGVPMLLSVGGRETSEFKRQTQAYRAAWEAAGHAARFVDMPDDHHYSLAVRPGQPDNALFRAVLADIEAMPRRGAGR